MTIKELFLRKEHASIFRKYCKGCIYFKPGTTPIVDICTIIGKYDVTNFKTILSHVKHCPCHKCLVKPSCQEVTCPIWMKYSSSL